MNRQNPDMLSAKNERTNADLAALQQKYDLVSALLTAQSSENEAFEQFKKVFNEDFMAFANKESSLADEAAAVRRLQTLEKRLEQTVAFPHLFAKRSVAIGGGFSSGKSAFVNSFIARPDIKLPVGIQPVTAIPSYVMASQDVSIKGYSRNGATVDIAPALYVRLSHDFIDAFDFNLKELMPSIAVEVPLQVGFEHICLLDTPGYDPAGGQTSGDEATAAEFLQDRDALIWLIDATNGTVPQTDLDFIEGLELNGHPFYVVLNKADLKPPSELEGILAEVRDKLKNAELEPKGISAYSSERGGKYPSYGQSLPDFFRDQNQPVGNLGAKLKAEMDSVFSMYEKAIGQDEKSAKVLLTKLNDLDLDLNVHLDPDAAEVLGEKIDKIKQAQDRDFAPIKQELSQVQKDMFAAAEQVLVSLVDDSESAEKIKKIWRQQEQPKPAQQDVEKPPTGRGHALHHAAKHKDYKKVAALLDQGADPNAKDKKGWTPLHWAAEQGAHEMAEVLLRHGADPNAKDKKGYAPLHRAAMYDAHETAQVLLDEGAYLSPKNSKGWTPMDYAGIHKAQRTIELLARLWR